MGERSAIEWTNDTWNPWQGCRKVSPGCKFCYMYRDKKRYGQDPMTVVRSAPATFNAPLTKLKGPLVFTCSWSDFFIEEADEWRPAAWDIIRRTPHLTYQILTKRPENIADRLPSDWENGYPNVWLGVSVETSDQIGRIGLLNEVPAHLRFVSAEPLLGPLFLWDYLESGMVDWVISGGESGSKESCRLAKKDWFRTLRDECKFWMVPFFHKQHGGSRKIDGVWGGRKLDGRTWDEIPKIPQGAIQ